MTANFLEIISAISAVLAAILWIASSLVRTPRDFMVQVISAHLFEAEGAIGTSVVSEGYGTSRELELLGSALIRQSRFNAGAAVFAAIAAASHAAAVLAPHVVN
ncbi:MAG: hypothetical protein ABSC72_02580 [Methylovirgula sp.]|jgi:hypothetical protein